jgi:hypothetical protein|tara:strand:- start:521 stop:997 length:477 start_codon:yes stop_codon:yes gene_type:complete
MKITRRQLRKLILKEFRMTRQYDDFDFGAGSGGGQLPPVKPPSGGGGGGDGEGSGGFNRRNNDPCSHGNAKGDMYYNKVSNSFGNWIETNMISGGDNPYDNYLTYLSRYPGFSMDLVSNDYMEFFELMITIISEYACENNILDLESIYSNPLIAINNF